MENNLENQYEELKTEKIKLEEKINDLNKKILDLEEENDKYYEDLETKKKEEKKMKEKIEILEKNINDKILFDNIVKSCDGDIKKIIEDLKKKLKTITDEKDNYLYKFDNLLTEKERLEDDLKELEDKLEEQLDINCDLGNLIEDYKQKIEDKLKINTDNYEIISNKKFNKLNWYLLKNKKKKENYNYNDFIWIPETKINIEKFNKFDNSEEQLNNILIKKLKDLEKKEEAISKLTYENEKLKKRNSRRISENNYDNPFISNTDFSKVNNEVPLEKYTQVVNDYNNLDMKYSKLKIIYKDCADKLKKFEKNYNSSQIDETTFIMKKMFLDNDKDKCDIIEKKFLDLCFFIKELFSKIEVNENIENIYNKIKEIIDIKNKN